MSEWKEFELGKLFPLVSSKAYRGKDVEESEKGLLYVTRGKFNNGIKCRVKPKSSYQVNPAGTISFGAENADFFYQTEPYITGNNMYYIDTRDISENAALYFKSVLEATFTKKFSFSNGMLPSKIRHETVLLPAAPSGQPDWEYMEGYMEEVSRKSEDRLENLKAAVQKPKKIDISEWKEFELGKLFPMVSSKAYRGKDVEESDEGLLYVTRGKFNNGIKCRVKPKSSYQVNPAGTISFGAENADFFYQTEPYITGNNMYYIDTRDISENAALYFKSILEATFTKKFSFSDGMFPSKIRHETVLLPAAPSGQPDWEYMEGYMKEVFRKSEDRLENLEAVVQKPKRIDTSGWKKFKLTELGFVVTHGKRIKRADRADGDIPLLTAGKENQGIGSYISNPPMTRKDAITVDMFGNSFYHDGICAGDDNIYFFTNESVSALSKMFIAVNINADNARLYNFSHQFRQPDADALEVSLPATPSGQPDWNQMENYMKETLKNAENRLNKLESALRTPQPGQETRQRKQLPQI